MICALWRRNWKFRGMKVKGGTQLRPDRGDGTVKTHTRSSCVHLTAVASGCPVLSGPQSP